MVSNEEKNTKDYRTKLQIQEGLCSTLVRTEWVLLHVNLKLLILFSNKVYNHTLFEKRLFRTHRAVIPVTSIRAMIRNWIEMMVSSIISWALLTL